MRRQLLPALRIVLVFTVLLGLAYPLVVTGVAQGLWSDKADGSLVKVDGKVVGSSLLGQTFTDFALAIVDNASTDGTSAAMNARRSIRVVGSNSRAPGSARRR